MGSSNEVRAPLPAREVSVRLRKGPELPPCAAAMKTPLQPGDNGIQVRILDLYHQLAVTGDTPSPVESIQSKGHIMYRTPV